VTYMSAFRPTDHAAKRVEVGRSGFDRPWR
jgi:hypothetical protein